MKIFIIAILSFLPLVKANAACSTFVNHPCRVIEKAHKEHSEEIERQASRIDSEISALRREVRATRNEIEKQKLKAQRELIASVKKQNALLERAEHDAWVEAETARRIKKQAEVREEQRHKAYGHGQTWTRRLMEMGVMQTNSEWEARKEELIQSLKSGKRFHSSGLK